MAVAGTTHKFVFYVGATGLDISDFDVELFTINGSPADDDTANSLAVVELGSGYYQAEYLPSAEGFYVLALHHSSSRFVESIDLDGPDEFVDLTQDTPTADNLKPVLDGDLSEYLLMVFDSKDWQVGRVDSSFALAMTELDSEGNWLATPLTITPGTYHIIIRNNFGNTIVIKSYLQV